MKKKIQEVVLIKTEMENVFKAIEGKEEEYKNS